MLKVQTDHFCVALAVGFQSVDIPLSVCSMGLFSRSPRSLDPALDRECCRLEGEGGGAWGGQCGRALPSGAYAVRGWVTGAGLAILHVGSSNRPSGASWPGS